MSKYVSKGDLITDLGRGTRVGKCPKCGMALVIRVGRYGRFVACRNRECGNTYSEKGFRIYDKDSIDLINLRRAEMNCDRGKVEEICRTCNNWLKFDATNILEDVIEALWM